MIWYVLRRTGAAAAVLLALSAVVYGLFSLMPGDPAVLACGKGCDGARLELTRQKLGLDEPVLAQYGHFLQGLVVGRDYGTGPELTHCPAPCLGYSFQTDEPVTTMLADRLPVSASLALGGLVVGLALGIGTGVVSALRRGRFTERALTAFTLVGYSTPAFLIGLGLLLVFCVWLQVLPFPSYIPLSENPALWAQNLLLPWVTLALIQAAVYARLSRTGLHDALLEDHVRTFRAYGLRERQVIGRHALRGALTPIIPLAAIDVADMMTVAVLTETLFGLPGIGKLTVEATNTTDLPVIVGLTLLAGFAVVVCNLVADLLQAAADPRVKLT